MKWLSVCGRSYAWAALLIAVGCLPAMSQSTGRLTGTVRDPSGAAVPGALVSLYRPGMTDAANQTTTTAEGLFHFDAIPPESYRVTVQKQGFALLEQNNVRVSPGIETALNGLSLQLGPQGQVVSTTANTQGVQTSNAEVATTLTTEQLDRLPTLNRNPFDLVKTQAGVVVNSSYTNVNGLRTSYSNVTLDGVNIQDNTLRFYGLDYVPNNLRVGQVSQFTLVTSNQGAIYGNGATQTAFVSPSGTNALHGSLFYLNTPNPWSANDWFQNSYALKDTTKSNQGGFTIGGPLIKDKLFGYAEYELLRNRGSISTCVGTLNSGLRSTLSQFQAAGYPTNPAIQAILAAVPAQNTTCVQGGRFGTTIGYEHSQPYPADQFNDPVAVSDADNATARLDYIPSQRHTIVASYFWNRANGPFARSFYGSTSAAVQRSQASALSLSWRYSPTAHLTNELRAGANIAPFEIANTELNTPYVLNLGFFQPYNPVYGYAGEGRRLKTYDFQDNASYALGRHNLQFGFQTQLIRISIYVNDQLPTLYVPTYYAFDKTCNCNPLDIPDFLSGAIVFDVQSFHLIDRNGTFGVVPETSHPSLNNYAPYFQDNWKVTSRLALTLGLRYDYYTPVSDSSGLIYTPQLVNNNILQTLAAPNISYKLGNGGLYNADKNNWAPNIGLAWDPFGDGRTAFRAAYGISYVNDDFVASAFENLRTNAATLGGFATRVTPAATLPNVPSYAPPRVGAAPTLTADEIIAQSGGGIGLGLVNPNLRTPYVQQWSAGIQRQMAGFLFDLRYVANHASKLWRNDFLISPQGYTAVYLSNPANSTYNGLQFDVSRRLRPDLQFQANYTYSKTLTDAYDITGRYFDPEFKTNNYHLNRGPSRFDLRHAFKANIIYDLPFGKKFATPVDWLIGGWSVSSIVLAQSGGPFSILYYDPATGTTDTATTLLSGGALDQVVSFHQTPTGPSIIANSAINPATLTGTGFSGQAFIVPPTGSPGLLQPRMFHGPATFDWDLGIQRRFKITERQSFELRGVAVNVLNHPSFGFNDQYVNYPYFGHSAFTVYLPRTIQLSAYYRF